MKHRLQFAVFDPFDVGLEILVPRDRDLLAEVGYGADVGEAMIAAERGRRFALMISDSRFRCRVVGSLIASPNSTRSRAAVRSSTACTNDENRAID